MNAVSGLHHVTAIAADPQRNLDFYAGVLGLRLVKRTVNFDDPQTYHLYYGDESGTPGSLLTFFPWPGARRGRHGAGQVAITTFAIPPDAVGFWIERLLRHNISYIGPTRRVTAGATARETESAISFRDPDGMMLELVGRPGAAARPAWNGAPGIPAEAAVRGLDGVTLWVEDSDPTGRVLTDLLGMRVAGREGSTLRLTGKDHESIPTVVTVRAVPGFTRAAGGAGTVHHVAFAVSDQAAQLELRERLSAAALSPTSVIDRRYFHSVYFREPEGVLFELATTGPGMTVDEPLEQLGERLMLPPQYEPSRSEIEAALPRIHLPMPPPAATVFAEASGPEDVSADALGFQHRYVPRSPDALAGSTTLVLLHGTGGNEDDLLQLGRLLLPGAALLSPRGKVLERGMPRFFRRLAEGVFDQEDLVRRTDELADFIGAAAAAYELDRESIVAVGFSNGANIAASMLLRRPERLRAAVLFSPVLPFEPETLPDLTAVAVFIGAGRSDLMAPVERAEQLADVLRRAGADVTLHWHPGGHTITNDEIEAARAWLVVQRSDGRTV